MDSNTNREQPLLVRQPIFDAQQRVIAYELLYGDERHLNAVLETDPEAQSTSEVILHAYTSISDQGEVKRVPAFIQIAPRMILEGSMPALPARQVVINVRLTEPENKPLLRALLQLSREGYRIALSGVHYSPALDTALKIAQIVKLDVQGLDQAEISQQAAAFSGHKITLMAANINSFETLEKCIAAGYRLFQGSFLKKPQVVKGRKVSANQAALMQLLQALQEPTVTPEKLESLILHDPILTYKLLRIVNSAAYSLVREVESVAEAVVLLGMEQVRKWATLIATTANRNKPEELTRILLTRGHMCEILAESEQLPNPSGYFMVGMMSGLHAMLDIDQESLLEQLPLGEDIKAALGQGKGKMGEILKQVIAYESGNWDQLPEDFNISLYEAAYRHSLKWTREAMQAMYE